MDDADGIIIPILRSIGCNIPSKITSMAEFKAPLVVNSLVMCLHKINPDLYTKLSPKFPTSAARKVQIGSKVADAYKILGYRGEIGYDKIIYPNEIDTRSILRYAVQQLPQQKNQRKNTGDDVDDDDDDPDGPSLDNRIHDSLKNWIKSKYSYLKTTKNISSFRTTNLDYPHLPIHNAISKERVKYCKGASLNYVSSQTTSSAWLIPSVLSYNHKTYLAEQAQSYAIDNDNQLLIHEIFGNNNIDQSISSLFGKCINNEMSSAKNAIREKMASRGGFGNQSQSSSQLGLQQLGDTRFGLEKLYTQQDISSKTATVVDDGKIVQVDVTGAVKEDLNDEEKEEKRKKELDKMKAAVVNLQERLKKMDIEIEKQENEQKNKQKQLEEEKVSFIKLQKECLTKKKTIDLIPNAEKNLEKLNKIVVSSGNRFKLLKQKWDDKKSQFMDQFNVKKDAMEARKNRANDLLEEIKNIRKSMRECANSIREKEQSLTKMINKLNKLPKTIDRQVYVDRILGVVSNLENQSKQIKQILEDVNNLQRDNNKVIDTSKRTFGIVDNLVFTSASNIKEIVAKRQLNSIYRQIVQMREHFDYQVDTGRNISNIQNETRDLEYQIVALKEKVESLEMKKIKNDLKEVEDENEDLAKRLKLLKKQLKKANK